MNALLALPPAVRFALLALMGLVAGSFINAGIYALAWFSRPISPWQRPHPSAPPRRWQDFVPVLGWFGLARESNLHGRGFWIRPLLLELACAALLPFLWHWEMSGKLSPLLPMVIVPATPAMLFHNFISHALLIGLMLVATFIDFDEKTIPDEITIPGTVLGLLLAAIWPNSHLPVIRGLGAPAAPGYGPLLLTSTSDWPTWLNEVSGLALGVVLFAAWCLALIPATITLRRGFAKGAQFYFASMARGSAWWKMLVLSLLGATCIAAVWRSGGSPWQALLSSLVGLAFGGGLVWAVRIAGRIALHKEAMGFGDVTLMAMIGSFLGWQPCLMIFFLSPFAALFIAVAQVILTGRRDIPYGPYLCASALVVILYWPWFWQNFYQAFEIGWLLPTILCACLVLMMALLIIWRIMERALWPTRP